MKNAMVAFGFTVLFILSGCASIFGDNTRTVQVNSDPAGATVFLQGNPVGMTPTLVHLPSTWSDDALLLKMDGYLDQSTEIHTGFQPIGLMNIALIPIFPLLPLAGFAIDAFSGHTMKVSEESQTINLHLQPLEPVAGHA